MYRRSVIKGLFGSLFCMCRSPSPEPIYSSDGKRLNTREFRTRRRLEEDRHNLVLKMQQINPEFKPPVDYKYVIVFKATLSNNSTYLSGISIE